jgi:hypothetical protein
MNNALRAVFHRTMTTTTSATTAAAIVYLRNETPAVMPSSKSEFLAGFERCRVVGSGQF